LVEENPDVILNELETKFSLKPFDILICDETSSQSGRKLPLDVVSKFCRENRIILVSCFFSLKDFA